MKMKNTSVLITGGAGGLGSALCSTLARESVGRIIIWDHDSKAVQIMQKKYQNSSFEFIIQTVDVADPRQIKAAFSQLGLAGITIDLLINNAAMAHSSFFSKLHEQDILNCLATNAAGPMLISSILLPKMMRKGKGHIVNICSAGALIPLPGMSVYASSKAALAAWSEALHRELAIDASPVKVTTVYLGHLSTPMFSHVKGAAWMLRLDPQKVSRSIIAAVNKDRCVVYMPLMIRFAHMAKVVLPKSWFDVFFRMLMLNSFMKTREKAR